MIDLETEGGTQYWNANVYAFEADRPHQALAAVLKLNYQRRSKRAI